MFRPVSFIDTTESLHTCTDHQSFLKIDRKWKQVWLFALSEPLEKHSLRSRGSQDHHRLLNHFLILVCIYLIMFLSPLLLINFLRLLFVLSLFVSPATTVWLLWTQLIEMSFLNPAVCQVHLFYHIRTYENHSLNLTLSLESSKFTFFFSFWLHSEHERVT